MEKLEMKYQGVYKAQERGKRGESCISYVHSLKIFLFSCLLFSTYIASTDYD